MEDFIIIPWLCHQSKIAHFPQCNHKVYSTLLGPEREREWEREVLSTLNDLNNGLKVNSYWVEGHEPK